MLTLLAVAVLTQKMPDTSLRLKVGDSWVQEATYHYRSDDIDQANVETSQFSVIREGKREVLKVEWKLKETRFDGEVVPVPKGTLPVVHKVAFDGEQLTTPVNELVERHRIERALQIERKGALSEPQFFPVPPNVRLVGFKRIVELDPRSKEKPLLAVSFAETGGDKAMKALGYYSLHPVAGILTEGHWTIVNCPIPGGEKLCELEVTVATKDLKLAPRK